MTTTTRLLVLLSFSFLASFAQAQARNAVYLELGGNGIVPSFNYERRVTDRWFGRVGFSVVTGETEGDPDTDTSYIVPVTASWISHPAGNHHFEVGGGLTFAGGDRQDLFDIGDEEDEDLSTVFATGIAGYRYQRPQGGFQFRAGFVPVIGGGDFLPWGGISFGYAW